MNPTATNPSPPLLLKPVAAARELGVNVQTLANWRHDGRGPDYVLVGSHVRYRYTAILEYVERNTRAPKARGKR